MLLTSHGYGKFQKILAGNFEGFLDPLGIGSAASLCLATFAECVCAILVIVGLFTRFAALPVVITMAVALFGVHNAEFVSSGELATVYMLMFVAITLAGGGRFSVDFFIGKK